MLQQGHFNYAMYVTPPSKSALTFVKMKWNKMQIADFEKS
jgi:hypothetical protein